MKTSGMYLTAVVLLLLSQPAFTQKVKLANVALGMSEAEVKAALESSSPRYLNQPSTIPALHYLVAETEAESFAFTFMDGHVAAFSLMHFISPGQQTFLPAGQQPSVKILRELVVGQTWTPATIQKGNTYWGSDAAGAPLTGASACTPKAGEAWLPFGRVSGATSKATAGLMKPSLAPYPANCGVTIRLNETPAASESDRVTEVRIQVLDVKAVNEFVAKQK